MDISHPKYLKISWKDMHVFTSDKKKKKLINNISGSISGGFTAIMGASGSGKSTLLNTLSYRLDPSNT